MKISLRKNSPIGLKEQIKSQLRMLIQFGRLEPGQALPPASDMAKAWQVNRNTVWQAYRELAGEGYVETRRGAGTFVRPGGQRPNHVALRDIMSQAFGRARELGFGDEEAAEFFMDYMAYRGTEFSDKRVLVVECNDEAGLAISQALTQALGVECVNTLIQEIEKEPFLVDEIINEVDLVVCGYNHLDEFRAAVPKCGLESTPVMLSPQVELMRLLVELAPGTRVGFTCVNQRSTENLYKHQVFSAGRSLVRILVGSDRRGELKQMVEQCDVILASSPVYDLVQGLAAPGKRVIRVDLEVDRTGIEMVRAGLEMATGV